MMNDVPAGSAMEVRVGEASIALFNVRGAFHAIDAICTHSYASLVKGFIEEDVVECPLHGARFSIRTGEVLAGPAVEGLTTYQVRIEDGKVFVGIPE